MATTTVISDLEQLEQVLKLDLLQTAGTPLVTLLQSFETIDETLAQTPEPSLAQLTEAAAQASAAWVVFKASLLGALPNLGAEAIMALINFSLGKVQAYLAAAAAAATSQPAAAPK